MTSHPHLRLRTLPFLVELVLRACLLILPANLLGRNDYDPTAVQQLSAIASDRSDDLRDGQSWIWWSLAIITWIFIMKLLSVLKRL